MDTEPEYIFRSYDRHQLAARELERKNIAQRNPGSAHRIPIWQVARVTSAAPTYFNPITIGDHKFLDGGFWVNNPADEIYREACYHNGNDSNSVGLLVSIGTGCSCTAKFGRGTLRKSIAFMTASKKKVMSCEKTDETLRDHVPKKSSAAPQQKHRPLGSISLDEWKAESRLRGRKYSKTLQDIETATGSYPADPLVQANLEKVAKILVDKRGARPEHAYWDIVSTGVRYRCVVLGRHSSKCQKMREESNLRAHLKAAHRILMPRIWRIRLSVEDVCLND
ncbi:hypothetical protein BDZ45DRAFT_588572 [Acephala macrosclerotiorum]|nr:hypothetical protein BDZ45DRAFT_588572 [Acephala macrosclerotiorum]